MNAQEVLHFIIAHSETLIGVTIGLALLTVIFILVIPSREAKHSEVDLSGIEDTLKRVIERIPQQQPAPKAMKASAIQDEEDVGGGPPAAVAPQAAEAAPVIVVDHAAIDKLKLEMSERERQIKMLEDELNLAKQAAAKKPAATESHADDDALAKIQELQSKLSEYAIIEEELADISKFKEENAKMKAEIEKLKAGAPAVEAPVAAPVPAPEVKAEPPPVVVSQEEMKAPPPSPVETPVAAAPKIEEPLAPANPENEDQVVREFKEVVDKQAAPKIPVASGMTAEPAAPSAPLAATESPLDGSLDTSKMLQEIEKLGDDGDGDANDPMAGLLDTEKLMAEVRELGGPKGSAENEQAAVDDLMSEFEAEQKQMKAKA